MRTSRQVLMVVCLCVFVFSLVFTVFSTASASGAYSCCSVGPVYKGELRPIVPHSGTLICDCMSDENDDCIKRCAE